MMLSSERLRRAELFKGLSLDQAGVVVTAAREVQLNAGEYLFHIGDTSDSIFVIERGVLELTVPLSLRGGKREFVVEELGRGKCVGWSAMVTPHVFTASGRATTDAVLLGFSRDRLSEICEAQNDIGFQVMTNLVAVVGRRLHLAKAMWLAELQETVSKRYG